MERYIILPDVACDLSPEIRSEVELDDYIAGFITVNDTKDYPSSLDWEQIPRDEFYKILSSKSGKITTAPASPEKYYEYFKKYTDEGYKVLSMSLSSKISSTYGFAMTAANKLKEENPAAEVYCFDTYRMSGAFGLLVLAACRLKQKGKSFEEVIAWLEDNKYRVHQMGPIDDLMFIARHGRISTGKAIMGSFAGVKPMGDCNQDGYVTVLTKVKGIKKAFETTVRYVKETAEDPENQEVLIAHSDREEYANTLKALLEEAIPFKKVFITDVYTGCGPNIGPGMIGVYYFGAPISDELAAEKEVMAKVLED